MDKTAIVNASPLIFLSRGRHAHILRHFASRILVPEPVAEEIRRKRLLMNWMRDLKKSALQSSEGFQVMQRTR